MRFLAACAIALLGTGMVLADEPDEMPASKLPGPIKALHSCAKPRDEVYVTVERFAKATVFIVSCPTKTDDELALTGVYVAKDKRGKDARRVQFPAFAPDGAPATLDMVPVATAAREIDGNKTKNDPPWITAAWPPKDRAGVCYVLGHWRLNGSEAELWRWEEASTCPGGAPNYVSKLNRNPPPLVGP